MTIGPPSLAPGNGSNAVNIPLSTKKDSPPPPHGLKTIGEQGENTPLPSPAGGGGGGAAKSSPMNLRQESVAHEQAALQKQSAKAAEDDESSRWVRIVGYTIAENKRSLLWCVVAAM